MGARENPTGGPDSVHGLLLLICGLASSRRFSDNLHHVWSVKKMQCMCMSVQINLHDRGYEGSYTYLLGDFI